MVISQMMWLMLVKKVRECIWSTPGTLSWSSLIWLIQNQVELVMLPAKKNIYFAGNMIILSHCILNLFVKDTLSFLTTTTFKMTLEQWFRDFPRITADWRESDLVLCQWRNSRFIKNELNSQLFEVAAKVEYIANSGGGFVIIFKERLKEKLNL